MFYSPRERQRERERGERELCSCCVVGCGKLDESDVLVLPLDMTDVASHAAATDTVINHFGQVDHSLNQLFSSSSFFSCELKASFVMIF